MNAIMQSLRSLFMLIIIALAASLAHAENDQVPVAVGVEQIEGLEAVVDVVGGVDDLGDGVRCGGSDFSV